jgi:hypothetical protein
MFRRLVACTAMLAGCAFAHAAKPVYAFSAVKPYDIPVSTLAPLKDKEVAACFLPSSGEGYFADRQIYRSAKYAGLR